MYSNSISCDSPFDWFVKHFEVLMRPWVGVLRLGYNLLMETEFQVFQFTFDTFYIIYF